MASHLYIPTIVVLGFAIFSGATAFGQADSNKAKKIAANEGLSGLDRRARPPSRRLPPNPVAKLPFQQAVIIYYNAPTKSSASSSIPRVGNPTTAVAARGSSGTGKQAARTTASSKQALERGSVQTRPSTSLQPVLIYYKTYSSITAAGSPKQPVVEPRLLAEPVSAVMNEVATGATKTNSIRLSNDVAPPSTRNVELPEPDAELKKAGNESGSASSDATASKTTANAISADHPTVVAVERAVHSATREHAERFVAASPEPLGSTLYIKNEAPVQNAATSSVPDQVTTPAKLNQTSAPADPTAEKNSLPSTSSEPVDRGAISADAVFLNNSAVRLALENQYTEARALLQRAIDAQPGVAGFHRNLSSVYQRMNMIDEALASARTAETLSPTDPSVVEQRCVLEFEEVDPATALGCYEKLNSLGPLDGLAQTYFGIALFRAGKVNESTAVLEKAVNSTPPLPIAINALGVAYFNKKRFKEAAALFKNAVEAAPDMLVSRYNLGLTQLSLRNKAGAISQYNILKVENPKLAAQLYNTMFSDKIVVVPKN